MKQKIILSVSLVVIILAAFFLYSENSQEVKIAEVAPPKREISVYVSGQVKTPAVVTLEDNGNLRAIDAVNAVGGLTELADSEFVNLAEPLIDGAHIHIPTKIIFLQDFPAETKSGTFAQGNLININTADEKELQKIRGVGPVIAGRIVEYRNTNGAFKSIDEIKKVRGIGEKTFEKMKDEITAN